MNGRLLGRTVFVTGASSGIGCGASGAACARAFAREEANLVIAARRLERLTELKAEIQAYNPKLIVHAIELDVTDRSKVFAALNSLPEAVQAVDVLVNNAGLVKGMSSVADVAEEDFDVMFATNVKGLLNVTQAVLPAMMERSRGHIINISSISGREVYPGGGVYCASKHAVDALTRTLRLELVSTGINVTSIDPGMVETEFSIVRFGGNEEKAAKVYEGLQPLTGEDIADTVVFVATRPQHVNIASMLVLPTNQAAVHAVHRKAK